jgi:hypothetical protein
MEFTQEFLVFDRAGHVAVYAPGYFCFGKPIGLDAVRLLVSGSPGALPACSHLTRQEFDQWLEELETEGRSVTLAQFWDNVQDAYDLNFGLP